MILYTGYGLQPAPYKTGNGWKAGLEIWDYGPNNIRSTPYTVTEVCETKDDAEVLAFRLGIQIVNDLR